MGMIPIRIELKALEGHRCMAKNYRCNPALWESGKVMNVIVNVRSDKSFAVNYRVVLDRRSEGRSKMYRDGGGPLIIYVGNDGIESIQ